MNAKELRELSAEELRAKGDDLRGELFSVGVKHATGQLEDTARLKRLRREIARIETVFHQKLEAQP
ncbi:MAG: 50S ribosomal protein L29 [Myxococcales bacterium]|nr:50S ribosomal protein L29 [Myxococcales bacterium]